MSNDRDFGHDVIWQQTLDNGAFTLRVTGIDGDTGNMQVSTADGDVLHEEHVPLAYGAMFGPDVDDVADWQAKTVLIVDEYLNNKENP